MSQSAQPWLSSIEEVIEDARQGRMFILVDDEGRENEGDLVIPAEMATAEAVNFMAKHGRGLICLSMTHERIEELGLPLMAQKNRAQHQTAFTVSIEAAEGVTTGISAADRARTIAVAIDPKMGRRDIVTPGHIFPLEAQEGGVLVRAGHTEAAVDISRMAGLKPAGVICEIMNDDGTMARMPDLVKFAQLHGLKIATIEDLIAYRRRTEKLIERTAESRLVSRFGGEWKLHIYRAHIGAVEHLALVQGDITTPEPVLVRVQQFNILTDALGDVTPGAVFGAESGSRSGELAASMRAIVREGRGVVVLIRELLPDMLSRTVRDREVGPPNTDRVGDLRQHGIGAQILRDLGVREMVLLSNTKRAIVGLEGYGLHVVRQQPIVIDPPFPPV